MSKISFGFENPLKAKLGDTFFKEIPKDAGVYTFLSSRGKPLYIGKADNLKRRLQSYASAKPGQTAEHILEMIEHAEEVRWEIHPSGEHALRRESELIRAVRPRYNIALNWDVPYLYIATKAGQRHPASNLVEVDFRLSHFPVEDDGFENYGCFRHRGKVKSGFSALLRLLYAAYCPRERFQIPAKLCRTSPAYQFRVNVGLESVSHLDGFLSGRSVKLLRTVFKRLLARESLPRQLYIPMQRDFGIAKEFFELGPKDTRTVLRRLNRTGRLITQKQIDRHVTQEFAKRAIVP